MEVSSPSASLDAGPRLRERPLGRCHTLDSGEPTPEQPEPALTLQQSDQTDVTHKTSESTLSADDTQPDTSETHSTDDCSSGTETPPSSPSNAPTHPDDPSEPPPAHTATDISHSLRPLNGQLESSDELTHSEALQSDSEHREATSTGLAALQPAAPPDGADQGDTNQTPERGEEANCGGCD